MRTSSLLSEVWRDVVTGTARTVAAASVLMLSVLALLGADVATVNRLVTEATAFQESGASILTITAPGRVDGQRCDGLATLPGVRAAGAISTPAGRSVVATTLPGAPISGGLVSPGFADVLRADGGGAGIVLSADAASAAGVHADDHLTTTAGTARVAAVFAYPRDGRRPGLGYAVLSPAYGPGPYDECWVDSWPQRADLRLLLHTTLQPGGGEDDSPETAQLNSTRGVSYDGSTLLAERVSRFAGVAGALTGAGIGFVSLRSRRVALAAALHDGMRRADLWAITLVESAAWIVPPLLAGTALAAVALGTQGELVVGAALGLRFSLVTAAGCILGAVCALLVTHERDLFQDVRDR